MLAPLKWLHVKTWLHHYIALLSLCYTEIQGVLQHSKSKLCVLPKYKEDVNNSAVVLTAKCSEKPARFRSLTDGSLQHVNSGMCLVPKDSCMALRKDTELVLNDQCGMEKSVFSFTEKDSLMHVMSKMCVSPSSSPVSNEDTTMVVLNTLCDSTDNQFQLVTGNLIYVFSIVCRGYYKCRLLIGQSLFSKSCFNSLVPMPTPTSLPVRANCGEVMISHSVLVIGGVNAKPGAWPWQVGLLIRIQYMYISEPNI